jgi:hypothetical protein
MIKIAYVVSAVLLTACADVYEERFSLIGAAQDSSSIITPLVNVARVEEGFEISIINNSSDDICIFYYMLPDNSSRFHFADNLIYAELNGERFHVKSENLGMCISGRLGCDQRLSAHDIITFRVPYSILLGLDSREDRNSAALYYNVRGYVPAGQCS